MKAFAFIVIFLILGGLFFSHPHSSLAMESMNCTTEACGVQTECMTHCLSSQSSVTQDAIIALLLFLPVILGLSSSFPPIFNKRVSTLREVWHKPFYEFKTVILLE